MTRLRRLGGPLAVNLALAFLVLIWVVPIVGLLVSSFRDRFAIQTSGWWTVFPHRGWEITEQVNPRDEGMIVDEENRIIEVNGTQATFSRAARRHRSRWHEGPVDGQLAHRAHHAPGKKVEDELELYPGEL